MSYKIFLLFVTHTTKMFIGHAKIHMLLICYDTLTCFRKDTLKHYCSPFSSWEFFLTKIDLQVKFTPQNTRQT